MMMTVLCLVLALGIVVLDQLSKYLIVSAFDVGASLTLGHEAMTKIASELEPIKVIPDVFHFTLVVNDGAALGALDNARWVFMIASTIAIVAIIFYLIKFKPKDKLCVISLAMILGGGIGNMIDRIWLGYVVDFLDFCAFPSIWKWTFNVADSFVCVGTALLVVYILFFYREKKEDKK